MTKRSAFERYEWYIINALMYKCQKLVEAIKEGEAALAEQPRLRDSLESMLDHCRQSLKEHSEALEAIRQEKKEREEAK